MDKDYVEMQSKDYERITREHFLEFLSHELISSDPYSLSEDEIWEGIKSRPNRAWSLCEFVNRMNGYCTFVRNEGVVQRDACYKVADYVILRYLYNPQKNLELLTSTFRFDHQVCDMGNCRDSFGSDANVLRRIKYITQSRLSVQHFSSSKLLEKLITPKNYGCDLFLAYSVYGLNKFSSIKELPVFNQISKDDPYFIQSMRDYLLETKIFLLTLVDRYPTHLMLIPQNRGSAELLMDGTYSNIFNTLYEREMKEKVHELLCASSRSMFKHGREFAPGYFGIYRF